MRQTIIFKIKVEGKCIKIESPLCQILRLTGKKSPVSLSISNFAVLYSKIIHINFQALPQGHGESV